MLKINIRNESECHEYMKYMPIFGDL